MINEYRHILKGSEVIINKGKEVTKDITLPKNYGFSDALLYQIGAGEKSKEDAIKTANELKDTLNNLNN